MRKSLGFIVSVLIYLPLFAQNQFEPTVVILYPNQIVASDGIAAELKEYSLEAEITEEVRKNFIQEGLAPNWKIIRERELEFLRKQDFLTALVLAVSRDLIYKELQNHDNLLIFPIKDKVGIDRNVYKTLADKYKVSWLVNIPKVEVLRQGEQKHLRVTVQLYNASTARLFLDATYAAHDAETAVSCEDGTWLCLIEKIKGKITHDLSDKIDKNRHHHRKPLVTTAE